MRACGRSKTIIMKKKTQNRVANRGLWRICPTFCIWLALLTAPTNEQCCWLYCSIKLPPPEHLLAQPLVCKNRFISWLATVVPLCGVSLVVSVNCNAINSYWPVWPCNLPFRHCRNFLSPPRSRLLIFPLLRTSTRPKTFWFYPYSVSSLKTTTCRSTTRYRHRVPVQPLEQVDSRKMLLPTRFSEPGR